jgi:ankyrin repeat protein
MPQVDPLSFSQRSSISSTFSNSIDNPSIFQSAFSTVPSTIISMTVTNSTHSRYQNLLRSLIAIPQKIYAFLARVCQTWILWSKCLWNEVSLFKTNADRRVKAREALTRAICLGNLSKVKRLVESGSVDINEISNPQFWNNPSPPLVEAAGNAQLFIMKYLIEKGAFIEGRSKEGSTPLIEFIKTGSAKLTTCQLVEMVQFLINSRANVDLPGTGGYTPLMTACKYTKDPALIKMLLHLKPLIDVQAENGDTALLIALLNNNLEAVELLLEHKASLHTTHKGRTLLGVLSSKGNLLMAKYLLEKAKVNVDEYDANGATALIWACHKGQNSMISFLVQSGADPNARTTQAIDIQLIKYAGQLLTFPTTRVTFPKGSTGLTFAKEFEKTRTAALIYKLGGQEFKEVKVEHNAWLPYVM